MKNIDSFIAINRFGLGAAPREEDLLLGDPRGWIENQINLSPALPNKLSTFGSSSDIIYSLQAARRARKNNKDRSQNNSNNTFRKDVVREVLAQASLMSQTKAPFMERMVKFWSNHFTVSSVKKTIAPAIPAYEREAIRPHIFGKFSDMLKATSRHPVMLTYLDNVASMGENSRAGKRRIKRNGNEKTINENLAREILELHTLGVNGGYSQEDIIELAKAISGWSHASVGIRQGQSAKNGSFDFKAQYHEPGTKTLLGKSYKNDGPDQGLEILDDLAKHPSTANFIATKLVRHFVADNPPPNAVEKISKVFTETNGDLAMVSKAIIQLDAVWAAPLPKVKTHYEYVISVHRAVGKKNISIRDLIQPLQELGQSPYSASSPAGWSDEAKDWIAPESLMRRIEWIRGISAKLPSNLYPMELLDSTVGPVASDELRTWVGRAPSGDAANAMILASPEFQRR